VGSPGRFWLLLIGDFFMDITQARAAYEAALAAFKDAGSKDLGIAENRDAYIAATRAKEAAFAAYVEARRAA
jgi:FMN phosphatase YigB (HAD superfamily)